MFNFFIMSFQMLAMKEAPLSEVTLAGTPERDSQPWRKAEAASVEDASLRGRALKYLEDLHTQVRRYL